MLLTLTLPGFLFSQSASDFLNSDNCYTCHKAVDLLPEDFNEHDIHLQEGLSCAGCHGGDPTREDPDESMSPARGFVGVPSRTETPQFCGKCHSNIDFMRRYRPRIATDQVQQYYTSIHGIRLKKGDRKVAECVSCHSAHQIFPVDDARSPVYPTNIPATCNKCHGNATYMKEYGLPTDQFEKFKQSVHGIALLENQDLGSPACNDCHGNHGAMPPGVESISHVCGNCHVNNMEYFSNSPMAEPFRQLNYHACEQCHGNHAVMKTSDDMVGTREPAVCINCHSAGDGGYQAADKIHTYLKKFTSKYDSAQTDLAEVQRKGMDDVEILFLLQEAHQELIRTRTLVHTFEPEIIKEKVDTGLVKTSKAQIIAREQLEEYVTRRLGFGFSTIFITILVIALYFKIRDLDKKEKAQSGS
ncbi:MAG: hypothetical protein Kow0042_05710 [Calditrichia bacterium]